jgi:protein-serine/threonine kinase
VFLEYNLSQVLTGNAGEYDPRPLDVWSTAIVMLHVIFGGALWPRAEAGHKNYDSLLKGYAKWEAKHPDGGCIAEGDYPHVVAFDQMVNPPALRRVLVGMLNPNPAKRCTIADVATNRWLKTVECCQIDSYDDPSKTIDASKSKSCLRSSMAKVVHHNHLPTPTHKGHHLIRLPGSTDMDL